MTHGTAPAMTLEHTAMSEAEALKLLDGHRITRSGRTMDPKAQIIGEFVKSIRVPGYFPPLPELRQQLRTRTDPRVRLSRQGDSAGPDLCVGDRGLSEGAPGGALTADLDRA